MEDQPRSASVYAETHVTLMVLSKEEVFTRQSSQHHRPHRQAQAPRHLLEHSANGLALCARVWCLRGAGLPSFCLRYLSDYMSTFYAPPGHLKAQWQQQQRWEAFKRNMMHSSARRRLATSNTSQAITV